MVRLARRAVETYLRSRKKIPIPEVAPKLRQPCGVFVTLTEHGELRGCIGHPLPRMPLVEAVVDSAISSATGDPRFPSVVPEELPEIKVEVSVLTPPELIKVTSPREYPKHFEIGKHGLVVEYAGSAGLLLPQVAVEWGWDAEEFLSHACMKAGLSPDSWLERGIRISRFGAQIFYEEEPGGEIKERIFEKKGKEKGLNTE